MSALVRAVVGGPYNFADASHRVDQVYCLRRKFLSRVSPPGRQVIVNGMGRAGARRDRKRAPEEVDAPADMLHHIKGPQGYIWRGSAPKVLPMAGTVEHPDIRYVVYPVHLDGTPTGAKPRLRHDPDCSHFEWGDGIILGTPELATDEQMQTLRACKTCIETRDGPRRGDRQGGKDGKTGGVCPTCNQTMPLTGICDNCAY